MIGINIRVLTSRVGCLMCDLRQRVDSTVIAATRRNGGLTPKNVISVTVSASTDSHPASNGFGTHNAGTGLPQLRTYDAVCESDAC